MSLIRRVNAWGFTILIEGKGAAGNGCDPAYVEVQVFKIICNPDWPIYHKQNYQCADETTHLLEEAQVFISGHINSTGRSHWRFQEQRVHAENRDQLIALGPLFDRIFDLAAELMPRHAAPI